MLPQLKTKIKHKLYTQANRRKFKKKNNQKKRFNQIKMFKKEVLFDCNAFWATVCLTIKISSFNLPC